MKTSEMFATLEKNPNRKATAICDGLLEGAAKRTVWVSEYGYFMYKVEYDGKTFCDDQGEMPGALKFFGNIKPDTEWKLVREPVPAWEAIKALMDGKTIRVELEQEQKPAVIREFSRRSLIGIYQEELFAGKWYILED